MKDSDLQVSHISEEQGIVQMDWEINPKISSTQPENPSAAGSLGVGGGRLLN